MDSTTWKRAKQVFHEALEKSGAETVEKLTGQLKSQQAAASNEQQRLQRNGVVGARSNTVDGNHRADLNFFLTPSGAHYCIHHEFLP